MAPDDLTIAELDPEWCVFWADSVKVSQFEIWLPYLRRSRHRFVVAAGDDRIPDAVRAHVAELPNVKVVDAYQAAKPRLRETPTLRGFLYPGNKAPNYDVVNSFGRLVHVWIGHGESEKSASAFRGASLYDSVFVANYHAVGRFPRAIRGWVGRGACAIGTAIVEGAVADPWTAPRPVRTVLYAPTWEGNHDRADYSSLPEFGPILRDALPHLAASGVRVLFRPHPGTGLRRAPDRQIVDDLFAAGAERASDKATAFGDADILIGDVSGVVAEFLFTRKPAAMIVGPRLEAVKPLSRLATELPWVYRWPLDSLDMVGLLSDLGRHDPLRSARHRAAGRLFRGHDSLEAAVRTFDLALDSVWWRKTPIPVRWVFEVRRIVGR